MSTLQVRNRPGLGFFLSTSLVLAQVPVGAAEVPVILDQQLIDPSDAGTRIRSVAIDGNTIVLGAPQYSSPGTEMGAVYVFERQPAGHWLQTARLQPDHLEPCMRFGKVVDVRGTTILANRWNYYGTYSCDRWPSDIIAGVYAFERKPSGWTSVPTGRESNNGHGRDLAFDGTSAVLADYWTGSSVLNRRADGTWLDILFYLGSVVSPGDSSYPTGRSLDFTDGLVAISGTHDPDPNRSERTTATLHRRDATGGWWHVTDIYSDEPAPATVSVGPDGRVAIGASIYEPDAAGNYVKNAELVPPCRTYEIHDVEFDRKSGYAVVRSRPYVWWAWDSLLANGTQLHLYRRISAGQWELVAQLLARGNLPANVMTPYEYEQSFAIDSSVIISNKRIWSPASSRTPYQFSTVDQCAGHRGNWIELSPQRWTISNAGGALAYTINTSSFVNQSGDRPGEYALLRSFRFDADFDFRMKARSNENLATNTAADYVMVFGYQDESNYYYMMFSRYVINNELFKVVNGVRQRIARAPRDSFMDNGWHNVEIQKRGSQINVLFDGRTYLSANDATFESGALGIGSYNDAASFDDIHVREVRR